MARPRLSKELFEKINAQLHDLTLEDLDEIDELFDEAGQKAGRAFLLILLLFPEDQIITLKIRFDLLNKLRTALAYVRGPLREKFTEILQTKARDAERLARQHTQQVVSEFIGPDKPKPPTPALPAKAFASLDKEAEKTVSVFTKQVETDIKKQITVAVAKSETVKDLTTRLVRLGDAKTPVQPGNIGKSLARRYKLRARRLSVTQIAKVYNKFVLAGIRRIKQNEPVSEPPPAPAPTPPPEKWLKRWDATIDARLCVNCREFDGLVCEVDKPFKGYMDNPPLHPHCRCVVTIWKEGWSPP